MEKQNSVRIGVTICDYCSNPCIFVDEKGIARCEKHMETGKRHVKLASAPAEEAN